MDEQKSTEITAKQRKLAEMIANGTLSKTKIAEELEINRGTLYNWLRIPEVQEYIQEQEEHAIKSARTLLANLAQGAVAELWNLVKKSQNDNIKIEAITEILNRVNVVETKQTVNQFIGNQDITNIGGVSAEEIKSIESSVAEYKTGNNRAISNRVRAELFSESVSEQKERDSQS